MHEHKRAAAGGWEGEEGRKGRRFSAKVEVDWVEGGKRGEKVKIGVVGDREVVMRRGIGGGGGCGGGGCGGGSCGGGGCGCGGGK